MKTKQKTFSVWSFLLFMVFILANASSVVADPQNYGIRAVRIKSLCTAGFPATPGLPEVPPPNTVADPNCPSVPTLALSPSARWSVDISWFDPSTQKFYMADRNNFSVDIVDANTDTIVGAVSSFVGIVSGTNTSGPNGVLTTSNPRQLWAGDGDGKVKIFALDSNGMPTSSIPLKTVNAGGVRRADEMAYDPDDRVVLVAWDDDLDLFFALISVSSNASNINVVKKISFPEADGFGIEQPVYDHATKRFYVAIPGTSTNTNGEILVIDPKTQAIVGHLPLPTSGVGAGCFPHGLALGPRGNLLLGCSGDGPTGTQLQAIIMRTDGTILQVFTQLGGSDEVWYNPGDNHYYLAMSSWTATGLIGGTATPSLGIINAGTSDSGPGAPVFVQNVPTTRTSHSVAAVYALQCDGGEGNGNGNGDGNGHGNSRDNSVRNSNGNNGNHNGEDCKAVRNRVYVPLTTTSTEQGGFGVYGQIP